ncbi:MAG: hypothetical protein PHC53_02285 [Patescibacteria group bacterium]|nr:hypothetical protein [Patescibacteria group bacterium]
MLSEAEKAEKAEENKGLLAYAIDSLDLSSVRDLELAKLAIQEILQSHGPKTALRCVPFCPRRHDLLRELNRLTKGAECRPKFVMELMSLFSVEFALKRDGRPLYTISPSIVRELILDADDLALIIEHPAMQEMISDDEYALVAAHLNTDAYWLRRVRRLIGQAHYRRAWDELYRASTGWQRESHEIRYCFNATSETVELLAYELYSAMQLSKCIPSAGLRHRRRRQLRKRRPLTELCKQDRWFAVNHLREGVALETATLADVNQEGLILMHLAAHFRNVRNVRRLAKKRSQAGATVSAA